MRQHREKCCGFPSPAHSTTGDPFPGFSIEREGFSLGSYAPVALKKKYISITGPGLESVLGEGKKKKKKKKNRTSSII